MGIWAVVRRWLGLGQPALPAPPPPALAGQEELDEPAVDVPEIEVDELRAALAHAGAPLVLDVREPHEWRLVRVPGAVHIPMDSVPQQLHRLPHDHLIVVVCAHGSRSYGVAAWLLEQGYRAANLRGGVTQWAARGGPVEQGQPPIP